MVGVYGSKLGKLQSKFLAEELWNEPLRGTGRGKPPENPESVLKEGGVLVEECTPPDKDGPPAA
jgi:hypothetical protein